MIRQAVRICRCVNAHRARASPDSNPSRSRFDPLDPIRSEDAALEVLAPIGQQPLDTRDLDHVDAGSDDHPPPSGFRCIQILAAAEPQVLSHSYQPSFCALPGNLPSRPSNCRTTTEKPAKSPGWQLPAHSVHCAPVHAAPGEPGWEPGSPVRTKVQTEPRRASGNIERHQKTDATPGWTPRSRAGNRQATRNGTKR